MIPVITGATGAISKSFRQYLNIIPGKDEIKELQNTATLGTAHILRKILMSKYNTYLTRTTLQTAKTLNTQQLQYCIHPKHGFFRVCNRKYPAHR